MNKKAAIDIDAIMQRLGVLHGCWKGNGKGQYPTIDPFEYQENLCFEFDASYPLIHYDQKTVLLPTMEPSHWESGFIRVLESGLIEIANAQTGGRVEVLHGQLDSGSLSKEEFKIEFTSAVLANDPRLIQTKRVLSVKGHVLHYAQWMSTNTTPEPMLLPHLEAVLTRTL